MRAPHTPGPWIEKGRVHSSGECIRVESRHPDELGYQIADVIDANGMPQNAANLALICAAPDLLEALQAVLPLALEMITEQHEAAKMARAAIARATGSEQP